MYKAWVLIGGCSGLALMIMINVFHALEHRVGLDSQQALYRAEQSLSQICHKHGVSAKNLRLVAEVAPAPGQASWRFDFSSPSQSTSVTIEVNEVGQAREVAVRSI